MEPCPGGAPTLWDESDLKRAFVALSHLKKILRLRKKQGLDVFNHTLSALRLGLSLYRHCTDQI